VSRNLRGYFFSFAFSFPLIASLAAGGLYSDSALQNHHHHEHETENHSHHEDSDQHSHEHQHGPNEPMHSHEHQHGQQINLSDFKLCTNPSIALPSPTEGCVKYTADKTESDQNGHLPEVFRPPIA
jgi:ABC-type Zn2+ transport system substrate-binding protein/surface adhesin